MITLSEKQTTEVLSLISTLWSEADYQLEELPPSEKEEIKIWRKDQLRCKKRTDLIEKKIKEVE